MSTILTTKSVQSTARQRLRLAALALPALAAAVVFSGCGGGGDDEAQGAITGAGAGGAGAQSSAEMATRLAAIPPSTLSDDEAAGLVFMREEEKLALDVYAAMAATWGTPIFTNIGISEQAHMDAVKLLLTRYSLPDPAAATLPGQFADPSLQALYDALLSAGRTSLTSALAVGAEIEELDIRDLRVLQQHTDNADLQWVYANLEKGSRNHLRSFHSQLLQRGATYTPKFLTQAEYDAIVNTPREKG